MKIKSDQQILSLCENRNYLVNSLDTDYKAEVIAAGLLESGIPPEKVCILPLGNAARGYSKDIAFARTGTFIRRQIDYLGIWVNRQSFYDMLPEGIFHRVHGSPYQKSSNEAIEDIRQLRQEEEKARALFRPLEASANNTLVNAQLYERKLDKKYSNPGFVNIFTRFWPVMELLPLDRAVLFLEIMSVKSELGYKLEDAASIIAAIINAPVVIRTGNKSRFYPDKELIPVLKDMRLGINSYIGNSFEDGYYDINIFIGPLSVEQLLYYNEDEKGEKTINYLLSSLLPADKVINTKFIPVHDGSARAVISSDKTKSSRLGINTFIYSK